MQNKTGQRLGVDVTGELAAVITRINDRPRRAISVWLIQDENGQPLNSFAPPPPRPAAVHHEKIEAWILEQAGIVFDAKATGSLRIVSV